MKVFFFKKITEQFIRIFFIFFFLKIKEKFAEKKNEFKQFES